jgi:hypothetical protein
MKTIVLIGALNPAGEPALRVAFSLAVLLTLGVGIFIFRHRHQFFDRDPKVDNDVPVVRHNRAEELLFVWGGLTLVLVSILYQVWFG